MLSSKFRRFLLKVSISIFLTNIIAMAQPLPKFKKIKQDSTLIWGEAVLPKRNKAKERAQVNLLSKIQVTINSKFTDMTSEKRVGDSISLSSKSKSKISNYTGMYLKGLDRKYSKRDSMWSVIAYIHRDSLKSSFEHKKEKIIHYARNGIAALKKGDLEDGLKYLYWGYLLSRNYPYKLKLICLTGAKKQNPQLSFQNKISSTFDDITIKTKKCYKDGNVIMAPLQCYYKGNPISKAYFQYYSGYGTEYAVIENGKIDIPLYDKPVNDSRKLTLTFEYAYENSMVVDTQVEILHNFYSDIEFDNQKTIEIEFPWINKNETTQSQKITEKNKSDNKKDSSLYSNSKNNTDSVDKNQELVKKSKPVNIGTKKSKKQNKNVTEVSDINLSKAIQSLLKNIQDRKRFLKLLVQYKKLDKLYFGNKNDFDKKENSYVSIIDKNSVYALLYFNGEKYFNLKSNKKYIDLKSNFKGKRMIWIKEK